jgi:hypothetical protein
MTSLNIPRVIRIRKSNHRQHNDQKKKDKKDKERICKTLHQKIKDRTTQTPLKTGVDLGAPEG